MSEIPAVPGVPQGVPMQQIAPQAQVSGAVINVLDIGESDVIEEGIYDATIASTKLDLTGDASKNPGCLMLITQLRIEGGDNDGFSLFDRAVLGTAEDPMADQNPAKTLNRPRGGGKTLRKLVAKSGSQVTTGGLEDIIKALEGRRVQILVKIQPASGEWPEGNVIRGIYAPGEKQALGSMPGGGQQQVQGYAAPPAYAPPAGPQAAPAPMPGPPQAVGTATPAPGLGMQGALPPQQYPPQAAQPAAPVGEAQPTAPPAVAPAQAVPQQPQGAQAGVPPLPPR